MKKKLTLSVDAELIDKAKQENINLSQLLESSIMDRLKLKKVLIIKEFYITDD